MNADERGLQFSINIVPTNDEMPKIYINDFVVEEGKLLQIDLPILNVIDRDHPPDLLVFKVRLLHIACMITFIRSGGYVVHVEHHPPLNSFNVLFRVIFTDFRYSTTDNTIHNLFSKPLICESFLSLII